MLKPVHDDLSIDISDSRPLHGGVGRWRRFPPLSRGGRRPQAALVTRPVSSAGLSHHAGPGQCLALVFRRDWADVHHWGRIGPDGHAVPLSTQAPFWRAGGVFLVYMAKPNNG